MSIVVLGNLLLEFSTHLKALPQTGQHQTPDNLLITAAGSGNTIIVGQRMRMRMHPLAEVGDDAFGAQIITSFQEEGIITSDIMTVKNERSTTVFNMVEATGQNTMLSFPGTKGSLTLPPQWKTTIQTAVGFFLSGWTYQNMHPGTVLEAVTLAANHNVPIFFDPGPECKNIPAEWLTNILERARVLLVTSDEALDLLGRPSDLSLEELIAQLHLLGPQWVVLKRGAEGICVSANGQMEVVEGFPVDVQDTTGAGDTVAAVVMFSYMRGDSLIEMATMANAAGAAAVQKIGAGRNLPAREDIKQVLAQYTAFSHLL